MSLVGNLLLRTGKQFSDYKELLGDKEKILSFNKVTGWSVNFPIYQTCKPSSVCAKSCYYAVGGTSWPAALKKQLRLFNSVVQNPIEMAERLSAEINSLKKINFLRWNGGGDLFRQSVTMLNHFSGLNPGIPVWLVTRIPELASIIESKPNLFIHFSLDGSSLNRMEKFEEISKLSSNYFYSYQSAKGEVPSAENLKNISVVFFDRYKPHGEWNHIEKETVCPLNTRKDITNTCEECRRCFNGEAVNHRSFTARSTA
jgi:hypothetical protein